jgi:hypothetical protein
MGEEAASCDLLTEEGFRFQMSEMGFTADEVDYQLERARGLSPDHEVVVLTLPHRPVSDKLG